MDREQIDVQRAIDEIGATARDMGDKIEISAAELLLFLDATNIAIPAIEMTEPAISCDRKTMLMAALSLQFERRLQCSGGLRLFLASLVALSMSPRFESFLDEQQSKYCGTQPE